MNHRCLTRGHNHLTSRMCTESCTSRAHPDPQQDHRPQCHQARQVEVRTAIRRGFARHPPVTRTGSTHMPARIKYVDSETESATRMRTYSDFRRMSMSHVPRCPSHAPLPPGGVRIGMGRLPPTSHPPSRPPSTETARSRARARGAASDTQSHTHARARGESHTHLFAVQNRLVARLRGMAMALPS